MTHVLDSPDLTVLAPAPVPGTSPWEPDDGLTPLDHYLRVQQTLTPVERFSRQHDADALPAQARYYRDLVPRGRPGTGQQYAYEVDLDSCSG